MENSDPNLKHTHQAWYAIKVFFNRISAARELLADCGCEIYVPMQTVVSKTVDGHKTTKQVPLIQSLMFIRATDAQLPSVRQELGGKATFYTRPGSPHEPAPIRPEEMEIFRIVTGNGESSLEYLGTDTDRYRIGEPVRVIGGPLAGAVGHICRIRGDKRLVVSISGVCAVATSYIPACLLQKIEQTS